MGQVRARFDAGGEAVPSRVGELNLGQSDCPQVYNLSTVQQLGSVSSGPYLPIAKSRYEGLGLSVNPPPPLDIC